MPRNTSGLKRGGPGRTKGSKDAVPRSFKASIRAVFDDLLSKDPKILQAAVLRGLSSRKPKEAFLYVRLFADLTGELKQQIELSGSIDVDATTAIDIRRELDRLAAAYATGGAPAAPVAQ